MSKTKRQLQDVVQTSRVFGNSLPNESLAYSGLVHQASSLCFCNTDAIRRVSKLQFTTVGLRKLYKIMHNPARIASPIFLTFDLVTTSQTAGHSWTLVFDLVQNHWWILQSFQGMFYLRWSRLMCSADKFIAALLKSYRDARDLWTILGIDQLMEEESVLIMLCQWGQPHQSSTSSAFSPFSFGCWQRMCFRLGSLWNRMMNVLF